MVASCQDPYLIYIYFHMEVHSTRRLAMKGPTTVRLVEHDSESVPAEQWSENHLSPHARPREVYFSHEKTGGHLTPFVFACTQMVCWCRVGGKSSPTSGSSMCHTSASANKTRVQQLIQFSNALVSQQMQAVNKILVVIRVGRRSSEPFRGNQDDGIPRVISKKKLDGGRPVSPF